MDFSRIQVDQFVHTLQYGDAISGEVLCIQKILRSLGASSTIYALNTHHLLKGLSAPMQEYSADIEDAALILHYSIASPQNSLFLEAEKRKRALIYHNLTPPKWYKGYNATVTKSLIEGRNELPDLIKKADICIADSGYNAKELETFGSKNPTILPLTLDPDRWIEATNPGIIRALKASKGSNILHVGRLAPNKCIEDIIKAFYFYHHKIDTKSRLWIVGHDIDTEIYAHELVQLCRELNLSSAVNFTGSVADCELRAFYESCDAYICMSEHEGFCVPLIEALHHKLPVIAFDSSAVSETLGEAGVLVSEKDHLEISLILHELITDKELQANLSEKAQIQLKKYSFPTFTDRLKSIISLLLQN